MEVLTYSKIFCEDLSVGTGLVETRLQDGRVALLRQIHWGRLLPYTLHAAQAVNGQATLTLTGAIAAGARVVGVTARVLTTLGGVTGFHIGDGGLLDRWGNSIAPTAGTTTDQSDFTAQEMPMYSVATDALISAASGTFTAAGLLEIKIFYFLLTHD